MTEKVSHITATAPITPSTEEELIQKLRDLMTKIAAVSGNGANAAGAETLMQTFLAIILGYANCDLASVESQMQKSILEMAQGGATAQMIEGIVSGLGEVAQGLGNAGQAILTGISIQNIALLQEKLIAIRDGLNIQKKTSLEFIKNYKPPADGTVGGTPEQQAELTEQRRRESELFKEHSEKVKALDEAFRVDESTVKEEIETIEKRYQTTGRMMEAVGFILNGLLKIGAGMAKMSSSLYQASQSIVNQVTDNLEKTRKGFNDAIAGMLQHNSNQPMSALLG